MLRRVDFEEVHRNVPLENIVVTQHTPRFDRWCTVVPLLGCLVGAPIPGESPIPGTPVSGAPSEIKIDLNFSKM